MKGVLMLTCLLALVTPVVAQDAPEFQTLASLAETRKLADQAMALVKAEEFDKAYASVKEFWPADPVEIDGLASQMKTQWPMVRQRYGKSVATEFIGEEKVGQSYVRYTYLQKFERHAIRWMFAFYRPADAWVVNAVSWDDGVSALYK